MIVMTMTTGYDANDAMDDDGDGDDEDDHVSSEQTPPAVNEQMLIRASFG